MFVRRLLLIVLSLIIGYGATYVITLFLGTSVAEFWMGPEEPVHIPYFILTGLFIALAAAVWLDLILRTEVLKK